MLFRFFYLSFMVFASAHNPAVCRRRAALPARLAPGHGWHWGTAARWHRLSWKPTGAQAQVPVHPRLAPPSCRISRNSMAGRKVAIGVHLYQQAFQYLFTGVLCSF